MTNNNNQVQDGYGAPQGPVQTNNQVQDGYGAPQGPVVQNNNNNNQVQDGYGAPQGPVVQAQSASTSVQQNQDSYGAPQGPVVQQAQSAAAPAQQNQDSYGAPQGPPIGSAPAPRQNAGRAMAPPDISNNVIKMLPAPNLATGRPNVVQPQSQQSSGSTSQVVQGSFGVTQPAQDSYGVPNGGVITGRGNINDIVSSVSGGGVANSGPSPGSTIQLAANPSPTSIGGGGGSSVQGGPTELGHEMQLISA